MTPARLLAPVALVAAAVALFVVVTSGSGDSSTSSATPAPTATATAAAKKPKPKPKATGKTYTVAAGDTPSGIAAKLNVSVDDLLAANPDADPNALTVGSQLKIP